MKYVMYPHGGSGNHGCEAIVRSTAKLLAGQLTLYSNCVEEDIHVGLDELCRVEKAVFPIKRDSLSYLKALFKTYVLRNKEAFDEAAFQHILEDARFSTCFLSIGGDNYCYGHPPYIYLVNKMLDRAGVKRVLWGASVEPHAIDERMLRDLRGYDWIWARESLTYEALKANGLAQTIVLPDPAFLLNRKDLLLPDGFVEGNTVGLNISPMIIDYEQNKGMALQNYITLLRYIIKQTDMQVALIPHVVWHYNDDRKPLLQLYEMFKNTGRVVMIDDHNAEELKGYIARCRFMVVARTHASIAAYSTQVPTLVVGYSVKARGIAKDIFGKEDNYVIPVQSLQRENELLEGFKWLMENEENLKALYNQVMPEYIGRVYKATKLLQI